MTREFWLNPDLKPAEKTIVAVLASWADMTLRADPTKEQIAKGAGIGQRQLWEHLQELKRKGFLSWQMVRRAGRNRNVYRLLPPCGICMMGFSRSSMQFPHESLQKNAPAKLTAEKTGNGHRPAPNGQSPCSARKPPASDAAGK